MPALGGMFWLLIAALGGLGCCDPSPLATGPFACVWQTRQFPVPSLNPPCLAAATMDQSRQILVKPATTRYRSQRAGLFLFSCPTHLPDFDQRLTQVFYQKLLEQRPFQEVVFIPRLSGTQKEALELARKWHLDLLVLGESPYVLDGGGVGASALHVDLKVMEARTGVLIWYLSEALKATPRPVVDLVVTESRPYPTPDVFLLAQVLADGMCKTLAAGPPVAE